MREYPLDMTKAVEGGLSTRDLARNSEGLARCVGLRPRHGQLVRGEAIHNPVDLTVSWPFPQLFRGEQESLVCDETAFYSVSEAASWTLTSLITSLTSGGAWHFADFGTYWILFNGECFVLGTPSTTTEYNTPSIQTGCNHNGRLVFGGLESSFWSAAWQAELATWLALEATGITETYEMFNNTVFWGSIGGGDLLCWLTAPTSTSYPVVGPLGSGSGFDADRPFYQDLLLRGDVGWARMPWQGYVRRVLPLGPHVVVYGDEGVCALSPFDGGGYKPVPITGDIGVLGRGAAFGINEAKAQVHVFVGTDKDLYIITPDLKLTRLEYAHHLTDLDSGTIVTADKRWGEFYISTTNQGFVLTSKGLAEIATVPTSMARQDGTLIGITKASENTDDRILLESESHRPGSGSYKMYRLIDVDYASIPNLTARGLFRSDPNKDYRTGPVRRVNKEGAAFLNLMATDFKVRLEGDAESDSAITGLRGRWQVGDNRNVRGQFGRGEAD